MRYHKLVRDKIPDILDAKGVEYEMYIADGDEYHTALVLKLTEEVEEFLEAQSVEELADVAEVLEALKQLEIYKNLETVRREKAEQRGTFSKRIIIKGEK